MTIPEDFAARIVALRYADLLEPIAGDNPCGVNLEYDPAFLMLQAATVSKSDAQYGDFVGIADPVNWAEIERDCRTLLLRSKDIRLLVILIRSRIRQSGAEGLCDGLMLLKAMLERYPHQIYPVTFFDGEYDPVIRANALAELVEHTGILADIRNISLPKVAGLQLQIRDIEKSFVVPHIKDVLTPESVNRLLQELWNKCDKSIMALSDAQHLVTELQAGMNAAMGSDASDLTILLRVLQPFALSEKNNRLGNTHTMSVVAEPIVAAPESTDYSSLMPQALATDVYASESLPRNETPTLRLMDRWSALNTIQVVRNWFENNEPSSPVIVLLHQAERMVGKRFSELTHMIPVDLLVQWDQTHDK